jgi:hypothetical protein
MFALSLWTGMMTLSLGDATQGSFVVARIESRVCGFAQGD